jgi:hypothetical protein
MPKRFGFAGVISARLLLVVLNRHRFRSRHGKEFVMSKEKGFRQPRWRTVGNRRLAALLLCAPIVIAFSGCGSSPDADRVQVFPTSGRVVYDGRPLAGAFVVLHPKGAGAAVGRAVPRPHAQATADGSFTVTSYESNDGAPVGDYTLTVELRPLVNHGGDVTAGPNTLPAKYSRAETSPLSVQIAEGRNDLPEIQIRR